MRTQTEPLSVATAPALETRAQRGRLRPYRRLAVAALSCLAILAAAAGSSLGPAAAGNSRTTTSMIWSYVDSSHPCIWKAAFLEVGLGRGSGYNFMVVAVDECTDETLLIGDTVETQLQPGDVVLSPNLRRATVNLSSSVVDRYTGAGVIGTLTTSQSLTFGKKTGGGSSFDARTCIPVEVDPATGEPIPGTQYMKERLHSAGGGATATLAQARGSLVLTLTDGRRVEFMTPAAEEEGTVSTMHGNTLYRVTGPMDECTERFHRY